VCVRERERERERERDAGDTVIREEGEDNKTSPHLLISLSGVHNFVVAVNARLNIFLHDEVCELLLQLRHRSTEGLRHIIRYSLHTLKVLTTHASAAPAP